MELSEIQGNKEAESNDVLSPSSSPLTEEELPEPLIPEVEV